MAIDFCILGPLEVVDNGATIDLGGQKPRTVLAMLLLHPNQVVSTDRLIDALWEDDPPARAQKALQVYVSGLRKVIGSGRIETKAPGYLVRAAEDELDAARFEALVAQGAFREALALWRGPALGDFAYARFAATEIARLEELRLSALEGRIERDLSEGRHADVAGELEGLVREHPLRERLRAQLMLALYRAGRQADALEAYQDARRALSDELGLEPSRDLRELQQAILRHDLVLDDTVAPTGQAESARGVFVGRERELAELVEGLEAALVGNGRLFLLRGEPGIGKSRLADEGVAQARARGAQVLVGRSWEAGGAPAYWPWVQALRAHIERTTTEALRSDLGAHGAHLAQLLPELRELIPDLAEPPVLESESARFRLFEAVLQLVRRAAARRPVVLVLDDLHAADEPSLLLLQFVARELSDSRILVIGAYRDVDPTLAEPLTTALVELGREPTTRTITLTGLDESDVGRFIELTTHDVPAAVELAVAVHAETEGNPLFVGEIVRLLASEGRLGDVAGLAIPQSVRDVIGRRLRRLSEEANRVLVLASVLGREFDLDALSSVAAVSDDDVLDTLDEAMAARVLSDVPGSPGRLRFAHVLIRDTLYEGLTTARRVRLHRAAVEALEALYGEESGSHLAELSHHAIAGSDFERGLRYARRAGDRALGLLAYEEAARLYQVSLDALELSDPDDERAKCELLLSLAEAEARAGDAPLAKQVFLQAAAIARRLPLPRELARAAAGYGGRILWARAGADRQLVPLLEEGLAGLDEDDIELRARLLSRLAGALRDEPSRDRRAALSREALELARRADNPRALGYALDGRAAAMWAPDTIAELLEIGTESREVAERIGDSERLIYAHFHLFLTHMFLGDIAEAEADIEASGRLAAELRQPAFDWFVVSPLAMLAIARGDLDEGEALSKECFAYGERSVGDLAVVVYRFQRYGLCDFRGRLDEIEPAIDDWVAEYPTRPFRELRVHLHSRLGQLAEAQNRLDELSRDDFSAVPFDFEWLFRMSLLVEACVAVGDTACAGSLDRLLRPYMSLCAADPPEASRGSVARYLGLLATLLERFDDAERHFEHALEVNRAMGARPWLAHTQEDYGRLLFERGEEERGTALFEEALATYRELGMDGSLQRARPR